MPKFDWEILTVVPVVCPVYAGRGAQGPPWLVRDCGAVHEFRVHGQRFHQPSRPQLTHSRSARHLLFATV